MQFTQFLRLLLVSAVLIGLVVESQAQVVSSGMTGTVVDNSGRPVAGVAVTVVHTPTNTTFTAVTRENGRFALSGLPVGGPYTISAASAGRSFETVRGVGTSLGENVDITVGAADEVQMLEAFTVEASILDLDPNSAGSGTVLSSTRIAAQPTSTRAFADLIKTNPFVTIRAGQQVTALGMSNRYNSITLDGARLNDQFGLSATGLFSLKNPFSLDAVEQLSVSLTPYDVTQSGFAGAAINVVSKSGTNEFSGSAYVLYTADEWQGKDVAGSTAGTRPPNFLERTQGITFGGPIIKDRLFFFANYEKFYNPSGGPSNAGFNPTEGVLAFVDAQIAGLPGSPDLGAWGGVSAALDSEVKRLLKLDWNITDDHRFTVRYSDTEGARPSFGSFNAGTAFSGSITVPGQPTSFPNGITSLSSSYYSLAVIEEVWAAQLFSNWTPDFKTQFSFSKNDSSSLRTTPVIFPEIRILNVPGTANTSAGTAIDSGNALIFGTEMSSMGNGVIMNGISFSGVGDYAWKDLLFKFGFDREETDFENLFRNGSYGVFAYNYSPTLDLANDQPIGFARGVAQEGFPGTDLSRLEQTGYFVQARWEPTSRFNVTLGLRYDVLGSPVVPPYNSTFSAGFDRYYPGIRNDATIDGASRFAPRISFNYALDEDRKTQVRGGVGLFLGRNPWVWISNSYGNTGYGRFTLQSPGATAPTLGQYLQGSFPNPDPAFAFDPENPRGETTSNPAASGSAQVNLIAPGFQLPTNVRGNIAIDRKLPGIDATFTVEYIHNQVLDALFYENLNLVVMNGDTQNRPTGGSYGADGRLRFAPAANGRTGAGNNPLVTGFGDVLRLRNVRAGESDYIAFVLDRPFKDGWAYNLAYTRGRATEAQNPGSSSAGSNWGFGHVFNQGSVEVSRSDFEIRNRVQLSLSKEFSYFGRLKSIVSLYYEGRSGMPFSYVYTADVNGDGRTSNDLVAVPTGVNDARFDFAGSGLTQAQIDAYFRFIEQSGLERYAGGYAPRNAFTTSWQNRLDLAFTQQLRVTGPVHVELFAHFMNFGAWLSKDLFNYIETINTSGTNSNQFRALGSATYGPDGRIRPSLTSLGGSTLDASGNIVFAPGSQVFANNSDSRWRIQAGVRVKF